MKTLTIAVFALVVSPALFADTLTLQNGAEFEGVVQSREKGMLTFRIEGGEIAIPESQAKGIETGGMSIESLRSNEDALTEKLAAENRSRRERLAQFVAEQDDSKRRADAQAAVPASFQTEMIDRLAREMEEDLSEITGRIESKLELLRELYPEIRKSPIDGRRSLRDAVLSDLFPNYRPTAMGWQ